MRSTSRRGWSRRPGRARCCSVSRPIGLSATRSAVEAVEPLAAKGKSEPLAAYRLLGGRRLGAGCRGGERRLSGARRSLRCSSASSRPSSAERRCRLVTVVGEPGVGKSRLAAEFVDRVGHARGSCAAPVFPTGRGSPTGRSARSCVSWPGSATSTRRSRRGRGSMCTSSACRTVRGRSADRAAARARRGLCDRPGDGVGDPALPCCPGSERAAARLVDDIHWAEPALLDLLARLPAAIADAPILVVCLARPELLESRPDWEVAVRLEPLGEHDVDALLESLLGDAPAGVRERLAQASAGNPLFAEELVAWMLEGDADSGRLADESERAARRAPRPARRRSPGRARAGRDRGRALPPRRGRRALAPSRAGRALANRLALPARTSSGRRRRASSARPPSASSTSSSATPPTRRRRRSSAPRSTSSSRTGSSGSPASA